MENLAPCPSKAPSPSYTRISGRVFKSGPILGPDLRDKRVRARAQFTMPFGWPRRIPSRGKLLQVGFPSQGLDLGINSYISACILGLLMGNTLRFMQPPEFEMFCCYGGLLWATMEDLASARISSQEEEEDAHTFLQEARAHGRRSQGTSRRFFSDLLLGLCYSSKTSSFSCGNTLQTMPTRSTKVCSSNLRGLMVVLFNGFHQGLMGSSRSSMEYIQVAPLCMLDGTR